MGAQYTKAQTKASAEYLKKFDEIKIRVPKGKKQEYMQKADAAGVSLTKYIIDKIEGQE